MDSTLSLKVKTSEGKGVGLSQPSLGFVTKAKGCKVAGQKGSLGVMPHAPGSARECEGIDLHTPKGTPTLGVRVPVDF
jgi:hypothetical protein